MRQRKERLLNRKAPIQNKERTAQTVRGARTVVRGQKERWVCYDLCIKLRVVAFQEWNFNSFLIATSFY